MPAEPDIKRAVSFFDGQNLYRHAKDAFGHHHPNYDPRKLADAVCADHGWVNHGVRFYTGVPSTQRSPMWHGYWVRRLTAMRRAGIVVSSRNLRYRVERVRLPDGSVHEIQVEREKGIDLRLGLDVVRMARNAELDVAIVFSQDQDLTEVAGEVRDILAQRRALAQGGLGISPRAERELRSRHRPNGLVPDGPGTSTRPASIRGTIVRVAERTDRLSIVCVGDDVRKRPDGVIAVGRGYGSRKASDGAWRGYKPDRHI